ncbi:MAG: cysteine protease LapG [Pseudomonas sp.]
MRPRQRSPGRLRRPPAAWLALGLLLGLLLGLGAARANWDFGLIIQNAEQRYGSLGAAKGRIEAWGELIEASGDLPERDKLGAVNRFFNRQIRFTDDIRVWRQNDYWATPIEALVKGAGDCEDYSIAKYFSLRRLGVPSEKLRITYVKALRYNQAHMVLTYYTSPAADPLVLDNLIGEIRPASQRKDLLPVYAFNAEGLYLPGAGGGKRSGDTKKLSRWQDLLGKMRAEGFAIGDG